MMNRNSCRAARKRHSFFQLVILLTIVCAVQYSGAEASFIDFYPGADARAQSPPDISSLSILCKQKIGDKYATFAGGADEKIILVVFTDKPVKDLANVITLQAVFTKGSRENGKTTFPSPTARVGPEASLDWAYIFDRNGDGRIDYLAFLFAALPVKPDDFPSDYPTGGKFTSFEHLELMIRSSRLIFTHFADDNFDGTADGVVAAVLDPDRWFWVEQFGVIRSTHFDGSVDESWMFKKNITQRKGMVSQTDQKYILQVTPNIKPKTGKEWFDFGTLLIKDTNDYAQKCGFTKESFLMK